MLQTTPKEELKAHQTAAFIKTFDAGGALVRTDFCIPHTDALRDEDWQRVYEGQRMRGSAWTHHCLLSTKRNRGPVCYPTQMNWTHALQAGCPV
jgi:hypothetical protein